MLPLLPAGDNKLACLGGSPEIFVWAVTLAGHQNNSSNMGSTSDLPRLRSVAAVETTISTRIIFLFCSGSTAILNRIQGQMKPLFAEDIDSFSGTFPCELCLRYGLLWVVSKFFCQ